MAAASGTESQLLVELRMQRAVLVRIEAEIATGRRRLDSTISNSWRSSAQREFSAAVGDVSELLRSAWHALDAAVAEIDADVAALASGGAALGAR